MRKLSRLFAVVMAFAMVFSFSAVTQAAETGSEGSLKARVQGISFGISSISSTYVGISVSSSNSYYTQVCLYNSNKKLIKTYNCSTYASFSISKNKLYYYRVRSMDYDYDLGEYVAVSGYSKYVPFNTAKVSAKKVKKGVKIKTPKVSGVKKWKVYMSNKEKSGYKKIKTIKPGKSFTVKKFKGKAFKKYKNYYVRLVSDKGEKSMPYYGFYIYTVYR